MTIQERLKDILSNTYDIERELGGGGMSLVFVAIDKSLGRKVVIKLLSPELTAEVNRGRFRREIQVAAQLQHPHIVPLLSAGEHEELVWFTMPFISGESLKSAVDKNGPLSVEDVVRVLYHVGEALDYAHGQGVVHRDIKPANILRSGTYALVTDFGVAKALNASMPSSGMTATGTAVGTPAYMAPEQLAGEATADHRIDIYALGLLAYELLKGKSPFSATSAQKVLVKVLTEDPEPLINVRPDVPGRLSEIVMHCLQKEPDDRPATARDLLNELDSFSTASGEIRTMEHKIPRRERMTTPVTPFTPTASTPVSETPRVTTPESETPRISTPVTALTPSQVPALAPTLAVDTQPRGESSTPGDDVGFADEVAPGYRPQKSNRNKLIVGAVAVVVLIAAGIFISQSSGAKPSPVVALPPAAPPVAPAPVADTTAVAAAPIAAPTPVPAAPNPDSLKIADSVKKAAKALAAKKAAAAKADSVQKAQQLAQQQAQEQAFKANARQNAGRTAVRGMFANPQARAKFEDGATHKSGGLIKKTKGDLQTQIDALTPFLKGSGLTYDQFKSILSDAGIKAFDEFGRMIPAALQQYSGAGR